MWPRHYGRALRLRNSARLRHWSAGLVEFELPHAGDRAVMRRTHSFRGRRRVAHSSGTPEFVFAAVFESETGAGDEVFDGVRYQGSPNASPADRSALPNRRNSTSGEERFKSPA